MEENEVLRSSKTVATKNLAEIERKYRIEAEKVAELKQEIAVEVCFLKKRLIGSHFVV